MERRQFLIRLTRWGLFSSLLAITGVLLLRDDVQEEGCQISNSCGKCSRKKGCTLPQAIKEKKNEAEG